MKLQKIGITAVAFLAAVTSVMADNKPVVPPFSTLNRPSTVYSPQTEEMIRYDHADIDMNTGNLQQRIPLIDFQDKDFDFPISIIYNGVGFRPQNSDNFVGRDWMLETGGIIYRTINGIPDDLDGYRPAGSIGYASTGFLAMLGRKVFNLTEMKKEVKETPYKYAHLRNISDSHIPTIPFTDGEQNVECSPDIFRFSFGNHSGKFMINYDGSISIVGYDGRKYEIDLSGMKSFSNTSVQETCIRIKTDDGYIYTFGGKGYSSLEYTAFSWEKDYNPTSQASKPFNEISAFYLTKITAPNGRILTIHYRDIPRTYHDNPYNVGQIHRNSQHAEEQKKLAMQYIMSGKRAVIYDTFAAREAADIRENEAFGTPSSGSADDRYTLTKLALIDYIETDQGTIRFQYSLRDQHVHFDGSQSDGFLTECGAKLDNVSMRMKDKIQNAYFNYEYDLGNRMFLTSVHTNIEGGYHFEYNLPYLSKVPTPLSCNIDHWGFWRGTDETGALIPRIKQDPLGSSEDFTIVSNHRDATGERCDVSLLKSITYPTGGHALFTYEPHRYSYLPFYRSSTQFYPSMSSPTSSRYGIAGGGRIHSVRLTDANGENMKETIYTYDDFINEGMIIYMPYYRMIYVQKEKQTGKFKVLGVAFNSEGFEYKANQGAHIHYANVIQHYIDPSKGGIEQKHAYKITEFVNPDLGFSNAYADNAYFRTLNVAEASGTPLSEYYTFFPESYHTYLQHLVAHPTIDLFLRYGKINQEQYFDENRKLKKKVAYRYILLNKEAYSPCIFMPNVNPKLFFCNYIHIGRESFSNFLLSRKEVLTYEQEELKVAKKEEELYEHDRYGYIIRQISVKNERDSLIIENDYQQLNSWQGFQILPVTRKGSLGTNEGRKSLWSEQTDYTFPTYLPNRNYWSVPSATTHYDGNGKVGDRINYRFHDAYGNSLEITKNNSESIVYLYGNKGQHLMAKLENTTYHEVSSALGMQAELLSEQDDPSSAIQLLREKLPQANVYTYTYTPNGLQINETSPDSKTIHYKLDPKGRILGAYRMGENEESEVLFDRTYHVVNN